MDKDIQEIMKRLGDAINESLQDSEKIGRILKEVEDRGYHISLSLALVVGLGSLNNRRKGRSSGKGAAEGDREHGRMKPTPFDRRFLKALRIKFSEEQL